ncbi:MAG: DUF5302 domain-containing protein [Cumulibacter sp.]
MTTEQQSSDEEHGAEQDIKDKFRDALEKKAQHEHPHMNAGPGMSKAHGAHGRAGHDKTFRRKSG